MREPFRGSQALNDDIRLRVHRVYLTRNQVSRLVFLRTSYATQANLLFNSSVRELELTCSSFKRPARRTGVSEYTMLLSKGRQHMNF